MLTGNHETEILSGMARSGYDFRLTGSRYFDCAGANSDWDFFVSDTIAVRQFLAGLGFTRQAVTAYEKPLQEIVDVYRLAKPDETDWRKPYLIDVQISTDVVKRQKVQEVLKETLGNRRPAPQEWELAFKLLA